MGYPGAGKSFFARQFSDMFGAPVVSFDRITTELFENPTYSIDEHTLVQRIALHMAEELAKTNRTYIVDGGSNSRSDRRIFGELAGKSNYGTLIIWVQTDTETSLLRAAKRNPQKIDDIYNVSINDDQFSHLANRLVKPTAQEPVVVISGKHTFPTQAKIVLKKLVAPREETAKQSDPTDRQAPISNRRSVTITSE